MVGVLLPHVNDTMSVENIEAGDRLEWTEDNGDITREFAAIVEDVETTHREATLTKPERTETELTLDVVEGDAELVDPSLKEYPETDVTVNADYFERDSIEAETVDNDDDEPEIVTDGGRDTEHVADGTIQTAIRNNDDVDHEDALTVADVRDLLAFLQEGVSVAWDTYMDYVEDGNAYVVHEDSDLVILATGEHNWVSEELDHYDDDVEVDSIAKSVVTQLHHTVAKEHCDHSWGYAYPFVMVKPGSFDAGERYVEAVVNGLQQRGLSPGQAWAYFGTEIRGNSMNNWGIRKGDHDHKNVSDALEKAKQKLPEAN